jgi:pimeloyl-ACP methyl ester carboxylesterase
MVGGIPRDPIRRSKLPLINKLYGLMATKLVDHGINSVLYNQPGTGGSSGDWDSETIDSRSKTLVGLIKHVGKVTKCSKHTLVGSSAGAYMAVRATDLLKDTKNKIDTLLLISPAAYPLLIESIPYGENFSKLIREPWDVVNSPVFNRLERFVSEGGSLLISFFEADDPPIPILIQHCYCAFARKMISQNHDVRVIMIPSVAHNFRRIKTAKSGNVVDNDSIRSTTEEFIRFII